MKNRKTITKELKNLNALTGERDVTVEEIKSLYDLIKKSDDKENNNEYLNFMVQAKNALISNEQYMALHYINQALLVVNIKYY